MNAERESLLSAREILSLPAAITDYRVLPVDILGPRGGVTRVWRIHTGLYHRIVGEWTTKQEALDELARLVNARHALTRVGSA